MRACSSSRPIHTLHMHAGRVRSCPLPHLAQKLALSEPRLEHGRFLAPQPVRYNARYLFSTIRHIKLFKMIGVMPLARCI